MESREKTYQKYLIHFLLRKKRELDLGLAHAFQVVEQHEGKIEVESTVGVGTTFHFIFPQIA